MYCSLQEAWGTNDLSEKKRNEKRSINIKKNKKKIKKGLQIMKK